MSRDPFSLGYDFADIVTQWKRKTEYNFMAKPARNFELCQNGRNIKSKELKDVCTYQFINIVCFSKS